MIVVFYGARQSGCVALLTLLATGHRVPLVVPTDDLVAQLADRLALPQARPRSVNDPPFLQQLQQLRPDLLVCCHGPEIFRPPLLALPRYGCINMHPCLSSYPGLRAVHRFLADGGARASVGVHVMTPVIDGGPILAEQFVETPGATTPADVYNQLYPLYATTLLEALDKLCPTLPSASSSQV